MGLQLPIVNAPMGGVAGGRLAAAVTTAGGLGMIGMGSAGTTALLARELPHLEAVTGPFGIGLVDWVMGREPALLDAALAAAPALLSVSFGEHWTWVTRCRDAGILTATQVYDTDQALRAQDAGVDILVARGSEGGGHGAAGLATLPLLDALLDTVSVPVLAAGGISSPRSLAAVLAAGAAGAWIGTMLCACPETLLPNRTRQAMLDARESGTITTRAFDTAQGLPWPTRFPARVLRNDFTARWSGPHEEEAIDPLDRESLAAAVAADDHRLAPVDAGQGVGLVTEVRPVRHVLQELCIGAERQLRRWTA